jgi:putative ABC transport system permease protein
MPIKSTLRIALKSLLTHKGRSALTMLGVVIGVMAIVIIVAVGRGAEGLIANEITSLGADIVWIEPGREPTGPTDFTSTILSNTLKTKDIEALQNKSNVPGLKDIAPAVVVPGSVSYMGETYKPTIFGWSARFFGNVFDIQVEEGSYFDDTAIRNNERVAVIGASVKDELFGESQAVGENIRIRDKNFRVIGILPDKGQVMFFDIGEVVLIPYTTAQSQLLGTDYYNEVWVQAESVEAVPTLVLDIEQTLRERHDITDPEKDDFYLLTQQNLLDQVSNILDIITVLLGAVVTISLVVGGVGVMNIMLVSVTERTREIGLRKAVGATENDITTQFLLEAVILTAVGGVIGIIIGTLLSLVVTVVFSRVAGVEWIFSFPLAATILGFVVSSVVGLIFGIYPARQAAKKSPIEALRWEEKSADTVSALFASPD